MENEKCKGCPYYESYFHGFGIGSISLSHRCLWTLKDPKNVKPGECHKETVSADPDAVPLAPSEAACVWDD